MSILLENGTKINTVDNAKNIILQNNEIISIDLSNQTKGDNTCEQNLNHNKFTQKYIRKNTTY